MDRIDWLKQRQSHIGGSDVAAILGLSRWRTPFDIYLSKTTPVDEKEEEPKYFVRGRFLEGAIAEWYADKFKVTLAHRDPFNMIVGPESWMAANPDATVLPGNGVAEEYGLECKSTRSEDGFGKSGSDILPVEYQLQGHWYMACTGFKRWDFAVFFTISDEFRWYTIERDDDVLKNIVDRCRDWWDEHIVAGNPPPIDWSDSASEYLRSKFPVPKSPLREAMTAEISLSNQIHDLQDEISAKEKELKAMKNRLIESIGDAEGFVWGGGRVTYKMIQRKAYTVQANSYRQLKLIMKK